MGLLGKRSFGEFLGRLGSRSIGKRRFGRAVAPPAWMGFADLDEGELDRGERAQAFLFGRFHPLRLRADETPDWHHDPVHDVHWPAHRSTARVPIRGEARPGDVKYVWEPSRFGHLFDLCHAGRLAGRSAAAHVSSWIDQNRWRHGVHWDNALEAALRAIAWTYADGVLMARQDPSWSQARPTLLSALWHHGRFIEERLSRGGYSHLIGDAAGLVILGASYPKLPDADRWLRTGVDVLREEVRRQVLPDWKMRVAGVVADLNVYEGVSHGGYMETGSPELQQAFGELAEFLSRHLQ